MIKAVSILINILLYIISINLESAPGYEHKYRYDININHETCTTNAQLRGYVKTPEMSLDNYNARFSPKMYSSYNFDWGALGCSRSNQMTITPDTSGGSSNTDFFALGAAGLVAGFGFLGPIGLVAGLGVWLSGFNLQAGGTLVKGEIQLIRVYGEKLCAFGDSSKDSVDGGEWVKLTDACKNNPSGSVMLNKDWHNEEINIPCDSLEKDCKKVRAFCGYTTSASLEYNLLKCLQLPFLPEPGKMYDYIVSEERPRLLYLNDKNNDFFNIKVIIAIGSVLDRCKGDNSVLKGDKCIDSKGNKYTGYKTGDDYDEKEVVVPFILDNNNQIKDYETSFFLNNKNYNIKFSFEGDNLCAHYKKGGGYLRLNCLHHPVLQKPKNIQISSIKDSVNQIKSFKMSADFAEDLTKTAYNGNKIEVQIDAGNERDLLNKIDTRDSRTNEKKNEFKIHNTVFNFFRAKYDAQIQDIQEKRRCLIRQSSTSSVVEKNISVSDSCDTGIQIANVGACDCGIEGVFAAGDLKCSGSSCSNITAKKCPNDGRLEKDPTQDCNQSTVGYYDDEEGDYLCLGGWNDEMRESLYGVRKIVKQPGFIEVENKGGNFVITSSSGMVPGTIDVYNLNDQDRKTMQFIGGDVFSIWRNGTKYYQWRDRYYINQSNDITYWMNKDSGYPEYISASDSQNIKILSPYKHGLCIYLDKQYQKQP